MSTSFADRPFYDLTERLFRYVSEHNFDDLAELCDDDFGIVDLGPAGESVVIDTREQWERWFHSLFEKLDAMGAETDTEITDYNALVSGDMGYSVVKFTQRLNVQGVDNFFHCIVTIIWKNTRTGWKESRWHVSLLSVDRPEGSQG
jgi:hypothetical protein